MHATVEGAGAIDLASRIFASAEGAGATDAASGVYVSCSSSPSSRSAMLQRSSLLVALCTALLSCSGNSQEAAAPAQPRYDLLIRNGTLYDGSGGEPFVADIAVVGDRIAAIGSGLGSAEVEVDTTGLAVAAGFINVLSWAATPTT